MIATGQQLRGGLGERAKAHGFSLRQTGPVQMPQILFNDDPDFRIGYAWVVECLKRGAYFHPYHNMFVSGAHTAADIDVALETADLAFEEVRRKRGDIQPVAQLAPVFRALAHA
jgi:glutamate-1-semialdehyde 2,1-aminomutase